VALHIVEDGLPDGPPLVLAGSLGSTLQMWQPQVEALAGEFRIIRIDHRGHGGSPVPPGPYSIAALAADSLAVLDRLGLDQVAWCGLSLGGMVGMYLGSEAPQRLRSLTLCCTTSHFPDAGPWRERVAAVASTGTASIAGPVVSRWFTPDWAAAHPDAVIACQEMVARTSDEGYAAACQAIEAWDHRSRLPQVSVPTLVIGGASDLSTPIEPHSRTLAEGIPGARLAIVDGAHLSTIECANETTALIRQHALPPKTP
jgi:3-oxoadipate enol-lactonase